MTIGTGHRSNNYSESKRNDHLDNNRRQEQRNKEFNLRTAWMGGFHLFADVAKYGRTYNRPVERSGDGKPSVGSNSQSVSINENVFQSFNSYAKAVLGNKSVDMSGQIRRFIDLDVESVKTSKALKEIFLEFKDVSHDFIPDERCVWIDLVGLPLASWAPEVYKKLGGRGEAACLRIVYSYTDDNEDVTQVIAPEKDSIICASIYTPGLLIHFGPTWVKDDDDSMVQSLIEDTKDVRFHKIGTGLEKLSSWTYAMKVWFLREVASEDCFTEDLRGQCSQVRANIEKRVQMMLELDRLGGRGATLK
ncbi:hypothetical protein Tco_0072696 [Tanacetum coccineum]